MSYNIIINCNKVILCLHMQYIFALVFVRAHVVCSFIGSFILYWESGFTLFTFGYFNYLTCVDQYIE